MTKIIVNEKTYNLNAEIVEQIQATERARLRDAVDLWENLPGSTPERCWAALRAWLDETEARDE